MEFDLEGMDSGDPSPVLVLCTQSWRRDALWTEAALHYLASLLGNRDGEQERMAPLSGSISSKASSLDLFRSSFPVKHMPAMTTGSTRL